MHLQVANIFHDGLVLAQPDSRVGAFWLPASDWRADLGSWEDFRDTAVPRMELDVTQIPGRHAPGGLAVVTHNRKGPFDLTQEWKGQVHGMKIESISKELIRGRVGPVKTVICRDEYIRVLNEYAQHDRIQDHGAVALGDLICGLYQKEQGPEGRVQLSFEDALTRLRAVSASEAARCAVEFFDREEVRSRFRQRLDAILTPGSHSGTSQ